MNTDTLLAMLTYRRPAGSRTERDFIARYIDTIPGITRDGYGNRWLIHPDSQTMIACHTDTVHRVPGRQKIKVAHGVASLAPNQHLSNCLGADDTAGIYAALRMVKAGVKASFVFHRAEEIGGLGSDYIAANHADVLASFNHCISLDRRGKTDIIEHQMTGRCCSTEFALELADALDMGHKPASGTFTDSANYTGIIPECSNLSIGYANEHRPNESLDLDYLERVILRLCEVQWHKLPVYRDPNSRDVPWWKTAEFWNGQTLDIVEDDCTDDIPQVDKYGRMIRW